MYTTYNLTPTTSSTTDFHSYQDKPMQIKFSIWNTFKHHIPRFLLTILVDILLPLIIYIVFQKYMKPVYALLAASSPPLIMVICKGIFFRTFDALGFLVFITFSITAIVAVVSRSPIILLLEKSLMTAVMSVIFGITLVPFQCNKQSCKWRPLAYYFYQDLVPTKRKDLGLPDSFGQEDDDHNAMHYTQLKDDISIKNFSDKQEVAQVYEWLHQNCEPFRYACYFITSVWSIGYLLEFVARVGLILAGLSINAVVIYGHIILSSITVLMVVTTVISIAIERKYTLKYIHQWKSQNLPTEQRRLSETSSSLAIIRSDSNCILTINT